MPFRLLYGQIALPTAIKRILEVFNHADQRHGNTKTVRDHYQAGIEDETKLIAKLNRIIDQMEPPLTAEKFPGFDQFHVGGLPATVEWRSAPQSRATCACLMPGSAFRRVLKAGRTLGFYDPYEPDMVKVPRIRAVLRPSCLHQCRQSAPLIRCGTFCRLRR